MNQTNFNFDTVVLEPAQPYYQGPHALTGGVGPLALTGGQPSLLDYGFDSPDSRLLLACCGKGTGQHIRGGKSAFAGDLPALVDMLGRQRLRT